MVPKSQDLIIQEVSDVYLTLVAQCLAARFVFSIQVFGTSKAHGELKLTAVVSPHFERRMGAGSPGKLVVHAQNVVVADALENAGEVAVLNLQTSNAESGPRVFGFQAIQARFLPEVPLCP